MGLFVSKLVTAFQEFTSGGQPSRILMLGLDAAGKNIHTLWFFCQLYRTHFFPVTPEDSMVRGAWALIRHFHIRMLPLPQVDV